MSDTVKDLTFYMGDKTDDELWLIVQEACRGTTPEWRAYERLRGLYSQMKLREEQAIFQKAIQKLADHYKEIINKGWSNLLPKKYWGPLIEIPMKIIKGLHYDE